MTSGRKRSRWNPETPAQVSPRDYELQVVAWLRAAGEPLERFSIQHLKHLQGAGGDYEFDAVAEFTALRGALLKVLVECKRYSQPVEREALLALWAKQQDVGAHKAIMFATSGFQSGALKYAASRGIATIVFVEGQFNYETKSAQGAHPRQPPPGAPAFAGILLHDEGETINGRTIDERRIEALVEWLRE